jgi:radical SAM protein with 4Fe4S-binding SPASM domain
MVPFLEKKRPWEQEQPRCRLAENLPLDTPFSVQIDPSSLCNFRCRFCPTGHPELLSNVGRSAGQLMSWPLFEKIVSELELFPRPIKTISLHKDGEPLLNPRLSDMVTLIKQRNVAQKVVLLTNASLLTKAKATALIESGLDVIRISVEHVSAEGYRSLTQVFGDYDRIVNNVKFLREERDRLKAPLFISAKLIDLGLTTEELEIFSRDFAPICDEISRTTAQGWSHSDLFDFTLGTSPQVSLDGHTTLRPERIICPFPFYMLAVNSNGLVSTCTDDWSYKTIVGDANKETLQQIWNGQRLSKFRKLHLNGDRNLNEACSQCHCIQGIPDDSDLDSDREKLQKIFQDKL